MHFHSEVIQDEDYIVDGGVYEAVLGHYFVH